MNPRRPSVPLLPDHWTPKQALAAFELIELLRDQLSHQYRRSIQRAMRADQSSATDPRQQHISLDDEPPF